MTKKMIPNNLWLSDIVYDEAGKIKSAFVENGNWDLKVEGDTMYALDGGGNIRNEWKQEVYALIDVGPYRDL